MSDKANEIVTETDLDASPDAVRRALTEQALLDAWLVADDARGAECEPTDARPGEAARYRWRAPGDDAPSEIGFTLSPGPDGGSRLRIVHTPVVISLADARIRLQSGAKAPARNSRMAA